MLQAMYSRRERTPLSPSPVFTVHRRGVGFYNELNLNKIGVIDLSHVDFASFPIAYQLIDVAIRTWDTDARNKPLSEKFILGNERSYQSFCARVSAAINK
jgi:hypothetical protein